MDTFHGVSNFLLLLSLISSLIRRFKNAWKDRVFSFSNIFILQILKENIYITSLNSRHYSVLDFSAHSQTIRALAKSNFACSISAISLATFSLNLIKISSRQPHNNSQTETVMITIRFADHDADYTLEHPIAFSKIPAIFLEYIFKMRMCLLWHILIKSFEVGKGHIDP